jgi:hypothetical protein
MHRRSFLACVAALPVLKWLPWGKSSLAATEEEVGVRVIRTLNCQSCGPDVYDIDWFMVYHEESGDCCFWRESRATRMRLTDER